MPTVHALVQFALVAAVVIVVPGPSVLFVIGRALALGRRAALISVLGNSVGILAQAVLVAVGVGAVLSRSIVVFTALRWFGAGYLVYLGIEAIRHRRALNSAVAAGEVHIPSGGIRFRQGLLVGITNPKGFALFAAVLPQFVVTSQGDPRTQMLVFGLVAVAVAVVSDSMWAAVAGTARAWFARSASRTEAVGATGGTMMVGLGVHLALNSHRP
jgi:threonine/homoserine/homoserine lactone efflux protein